MAGKRKRPKLREKDGCFVTDIYKPDGKRTTISFGAVGERSEGEADQRVLCPHNAQTHMNS